MQGRLSPLIDGKIQAFPWPFWRDEFEIAARNGFQIMEWTLDQERLYENPIMTEAGRLDISALMTKSGVCIPTLTGDCFMQSPFYKMDGEDRDRLLRDLSAIIAAAGSIGIKSVLMPLVDDGRLENQSQEENLKDGLKQITPQLKRAGMKISFESDFNPERLNRFIKQFDPDFFGITYDIGNSASLGFDHQVEIAAYGNRIINVHVKDRLLGGTTVPLGSGAAELPSVLKSLLGIGYTGPFILQTARADDADHVGVLCKYRNMVLNWCKT